jgi:hypothetical protein
VHTLRFKVRLASEGDISFIPVEPLVESINQPILAFVSCVDWLVNVFILVLPFLLPHLLQFVFVTLELQQLWTSLEHWIENNFVIQMCWKHLAGLIKRNHAQ